MGLSVPSGTKGDSRSGLDGTPCRCGGVSGTEDLCLLIRVSQVRDLHGLLHSEDPPVLGSFERIRVSSHSINRHPDFIVFRPEFQVITI